MERALALHPTCYADCRFIQKFQAPGNAGTKSWQDKGEGGSYQQKFRQLKKRPGRVSEKNDHFEKLLGHCRAVLVGRGWAEAQPTSGSPEVTHNPQPNRQ